MNLEIGKTIRKYRIDKNVTQEELADYLMISYQAVSKWENGVSMPDITLLPKIAVFFGLKIDDLFCIADSDTFDRIDYILAHEHTITDENFIYASRFIDEQLKINENDVEALKRYANLYLHRINRYNLAACRCLQKAITASPFDRELIYQLVQTRKARQESAASFLEELITKYPSNTVAKEALIKEYIDQKRFDKAREIISDLREIEDMAEYSLYEFDMELYAIDRDKLTSILNNIAEKSSTVYWSIGERFNKILRDYDSALMYYKKHFEVQTKPRQLQGVYSQAFLYNELGEYQKSIEAWQTIMQVLAKDYDIIDGENVDWCVREIDNLRKKL
jgi:Predicted transcriptional regulators